jgi:hypothetical protein
MAGQLAESILSLVEGLTQGPPVDRSVHLQSRAAGVVANLMFVVQCCPRSLGRTGRFVIRLNWLKRMDI